MNNLWQRPTKSVLWKATTKLHGVYRMSYFLSCCAQMGCRVVYTILRSGIKWIWTQTSCYWLVVTSYAQIRRLFVFFLQNLKGHRWLVLRVKIHWGIIWCNIIKVSHNLISFVSFNFQIQLPTAFPVGLISNLFVVLMFFLLSPMLVSFESLYHSVLVWFTAKSKAFAVMPTTILKSGWLWWPLICRSLEQNSQVHV